MVVLGLFPSLLFAQLYRMEVDAQESGSQKVIDRVFTGNTVGLQVSFYDGGDPLPVTNWTMRFMYGYGQYDTNGMVPVFGTAGASNNVVVFDSATNVFFSENGSYYFSIVGTNTAGKVRTFARGRMIEEYDPATGGSYSNGIPMPWANLNFASKEWIVEYISTNEFETVVSYGTNSTTAYRGDWGASASNIAAQAAGWGDHAAAGYATGTPVYAETDSIALAAIVTNGAVASNAYAAATNAQQVANAALPASATNGWETGSHAGLMSLDGGSSRGTIRAVGNDIGYSIGIGVVDWVPDYESSYVGFDNYDGTGVLSLRSGTAENGHKAEFYLTEKVPYNSTEPWGGVTNTPLTLRPLHANIVADWIKIGTNAAVSNWPTDGGISAADAGTIATNVVAAYTNAMPLPGCAILPVDPATSNAWITGAYEFYAITSNLTPVNLCISNTVRRIGYSVTMMTTQAVTLATNMVRIGAAWTPSGTNLVVVWPHCDAALWRVKGQAQ